MKKFIISTILVAAFLLSAGCLVSNAAQNTQSDVLVLFDFASDEMYEEDGANKFTMDGQGMRFPKASTQKLHGDFCGNWKIDGYGSGCIIYPNEAKVEYTGTDFTDYNCFNFWAYNAEEQDSEKCFWIVLQSYPNAWRNRASVKITRDWTGWKKFTFRFDEFKISGSFDWSKVSAVNLKRATEDGEAGAAGSGYWTEMFFDKIWLSNDNPGYIVMDMREPYLSKIKSRDNGKIAFSADTSVDGLLGYAGKWNESQNENGPTVFWNNAASPTDLSGFTHINFAVNSSGAGTGDKPRDIRIYGYQGGNWNQYSVVASWKGRQFFSVPLSSFSLGGSSASFDWSKTQGLRIATTVLNDNIIHFDRISFLNGEAGEFKATGGGTQNGAKGIPVKTKIFTVKFTNKLSEYMAPGTVTVTKDGENFTDFYFASTGKNAEIIFKNDLEVNTEYEITVKNVFDIYGQKLEEPACLTFKTERSEEQKQFVKDVNSSENGDDVLLLINSGGYEADFGTDTQNEELSKHITTVIFEQKPYSDYDSIIDMSKKALSVLKKLNECDIVSMSGFLKNNSDFVLFGVSEYDYYKELEARKLNDVTGKFIRDEEYRSFETFRKAFSDAVKEAQEEENEPAPETPKPKNDKGGGGGGKVYTISPEKENVVEEEKKEPENIPEEYFTDLDEYEWARKAVNELLEKDVISKDETKLFRPQDNVTRAEFLKMLIKAFNMEEQSPKCYFADISEDDWYYTYAAIAFKKGIVFGDDENKFGAERFITRQDAAVMASRAVKAMGKAFKEASQSVTFDDAGEIDGYAYEAVLNMARAEIINGVGNNTFSPKSFANRAQAVKIIYELIQKAKGEVL